MLCQMITLTIYLITCTCVLVPMLFKSIEELLLMTLPREFENIRSVSCCGGERIQPRTAGGQLPTHPPQQEQSDLTTPISIVSSSPPPPPSSPPSSPSPSTSRRLHQSDGQAPVAVALHNLLSHPCLVCSPLGVVLVFVANMKEWPFVNRRSFVCLNCGSSSSCVCCAVGAGHQRTIGWHSIRC